MSSLDSDLTPTQWALARQIQTLADEHPEHIKLEIVALADGKSVVHAKITSADPQDRATFERYVNYVLNST